MPDDSKMESPGLEQTVDGTVDTIYLAAPRRKIVVTKLMKARLIKARLHLNLMHAQQEKSSRLPEVSSSSRPF